MPVFGVPVVVGAVEDVGFCEWGEGEAGWEVLFGRGGSVRRGGRGHCGDGVHG